MSMYVCTYMSVLLISKFHTLVFLIGNLNRKITESQLFNAIEGITHIKWITDKLTQEFYGSTFVEMRDPQAAVNAVMMDKQKLMGR